VVFKIVYSIRAAADFQCLHVLAGALGVAWLARVRGLSWMAAALAGGAYHLFGGFFCNAEHVDIVRGYALLPFLLAGSTLADSKPWSKPPARLWSIPFSVVCLATGVYPGQVPPILAITCLYLGVQVLDGERHRWLERARQAGFHLVMLLLGLVIALPSIGPSLLLKTEIDRAQAPISANGLGVNHIFTTVFGYQSPLLTTDISMSSFFVTVPVLLGLFFVPWSALRRHRALVAVFLAAAVMIPAGFVYMLVVRLVPSFGYSRFPIADYRALLAIPIILLGVLGLERLVRCEIRLSWIEAARGTALLGFLIVGAQRFKWRALPSSQIRDIAIVIAAIVVVVLLAWVRRLPRAVLTLALALVVFFDGSRMHNLVTLTWKGPPSNDSFSEAKRDVQRSAQTRLSARPSRAQTGWAFGHHYPPNLNGYLHGQWVADDYAVSDHLRVIDFARNEPQIAKYFYSASHPKVIDPAHMLSPAQVATSPDAQTRGRATPAGFEAEKVVYDVTALGESILVENEPAFAGWRGVAHCEDPGRHAEAALVPELWPLRAWRIPAGQYRFCATFRLPGLRLCLLISGFALLAWLGGGILFWWRSRKGVEPGKEQHAVA